MVIENNVGIEYGFHHKALGSTITAAFVKRRISGRSRFFQNLLSLSLVGRMSDDDFNPESEFPVKTISVPLVTY